VQKNELLAFWSQPRSSRRASETLARCEEVFIVAPGLARDTSGSHWVACPQLKLTAVARERAGAGDGAPAS